MSCARSPISSCQKDYRLCRCDHVGFFEPPSNCAFGLKSHSATDEILIEHDNANFRLGGRNLP
jgi:hypothetical protein